MGIYSQADGNRKKRLTLRPESGLMQFQAPPMLRQPSAVLVEEAMPEATEIQKRPTLTETQQQFPSADACMEAVRTTFMRLTFTK